MTKTHKPINDTVIKMGMLLLLLWIYALSIYFVFTYRIDFSSLYAACKFLVDGANPYQALFSTFLPKVQKLPANLNPPIVLLLFSPLAHLNYNSASAIWSIISFLLGITGAGIAFKYAFSPTFLKKNSHYLYFIYLASFATISNTVLSQLGGLLLFCMMFGYHLYMKQRNYSAGILWGIIIAMKLFPALIIVYAFAQKRYRVCVTILGVTCLLWLLPLLVYGMDVYTYYFSMMRKVLWYGDSWNASIYGMLFRLFGGRDYPLADLLSVNIAYGIIFALTFLLYVKRILTIEKEKIVHQSFCLTLVMMLLLSPLGWLYYFPLLILPLALTWQMSVHKKTKPAKMVLLWFLCLFLINFPMNYIRSDKIVSIVGKLTLYSFHFYGLLLLLYLTTKIKWHKEALTGSSVATSFTSVFAVILTFEIIIIILNFSRQIFF